MGQERIVFSSTTSDPLLWKMSAACAFGHAGAVVLCPGKHAGECHAASGMEALSLGTYACTLRASERHREILTRTRKKLAKNICCGKFWKAKFSSFGFRVYLDQSVFRYGELGPFEQKKPFKFEKQ